MSSPWSLLQAKQAQFPQPFFIGEVLQPSDHLSSRPLDPLQELHVFLVLGAQAWIQYSRSKCKIHRQPKLCFSPITKLPKMRSLQGLLYENSLTDSPSPGSTVPKEWPQMEAVEVECLACLRRAVSGSSSCQYASRHNC